MHRAEDEEGAASERGGKSRAVYFWWGVALTLLSSLALFALIVISMPLGPTEGRGASRPGLWHVLAWLTVGFPWLVALGLAVARLRKGPSIHFVAYACGALLVVAIVVAGLTVIAMRGV